MTGKERREQLLGIGRRLFAERGFEGTSIEEIAAQADVSKPVVYEHFGGKEGLYAVVVDREVERLLTMATTLLGGARTRETFEVAAVGLLRYIDENTDGFRILVRDSNPGSGTGTYGTLLSDIAGQDVLHLAGDVAQQRAVGAGARPGVGVPDQDAEPVGVVVDVPEQAHRRGLELVPGAGAVQERGGHRQQPLDLAVDHDRVQTFLAAEVLVHHRLGNPGLGCDLLD